jgi:mRNA-degrading endonuclease toxin of MazEF toxin-antitoxin module
VNRGEVWWVEEPGMGRRPFLVLTRQAVIPMINKITGVPATKRIRGYRRRSCSRPMTGCRPTVS